MVTKCISDVLAKNARKVFDGVLQYQINLHNRYYKEDVFTMLFVQIDDIKSISKDDISSLYDEVANFLLCNTNILDVISLISSDKFGILLPQATSVQGQILGTKIKEFCQNKSYKLNIAIGEYNEDTKDEYLIRLNNLLLKKIGNDRKNHLLS